MRVPTSLTITISQIRPNRFWPVAVVLLTLHLAAGIFLNITPQLRLTMSAATISSLNGFAFSFPIDPARGRIYAIASDSSVAPFASSLTLEENGHALGPPHSLHVKIVETGAGRYSHWLDTLQFSTSDGSDPRSNGRTYTISVSRDVRPLLRVLTLIALAILDIAFFVVFRGQIMRLLRTRHNQIAVAIAVACIVTAALAAFGVFGRITIAQPGPVKDAALVVSTVLHALFGCIVSAGIWAAGAGVYQFCTRDRQASLAQVLIPAFPLSLLLLTVLVAIALCLPAGRIIAAILWSACLLPLAGWRPPPTQFVRLSATFLGVASLAVVFGVWMGMLWHGPTGTQSGAPSGDLTFYTAMIWSLDLHPYPLVDLGFEGNVSLGYFNLLIPALGAALLHLPGFDPFLFLLAGGSAAYILLSALMLHVFVTDPNTPRMGILDHLIIVLAMVVAARYPYWVVESIPVVTVPALAISVWWMAARGQSSFRWTVAAALTGLGGSVVSKVATAVVLAPLGASGALRAFKTLPATARVITLALGSLFVLYSLGMLHTYLPAYLASARVGPETWRTPHWYFLLRDGSSIVLAALAWLAMPAAAASALTIGVMSFLAFSWVFQINFVCVCILLGLALISGRNVSRSIKWLAVLAFAMSLPATIMADQAGQSSGFAWLICLGGSVIIAVLNAAENQGGGVRIAVRRSTALAAVTAMIGALGLIGVMQGSIVANSGFYAVSTTITPEHKAVWTAVRQLTPKDALIFTDQVDDTENILGGWNTFAYSGQRQIYLSSYVTSFSLRNNRAGLRDLLRINEDVLNGTLAPNAVATQRRYDSYFAVVAPNRTVPPGWQKVYGNSTSMLYRMSPS